MRKNFLFLGFAIPDHEMQNSFKQDKHPEVQTHKFNWNVIKGLETQNKADFTYLSARPVSEYPEYPIRKMPGKIWENEVDGKKIRIRELPYINTSLLKIITRTLSCFYYSIKDFHKNQNKGGVIVYSVHVPFMLVGFILSKLYKVDLIGIWTDPPAVRIEGEKGLKSLLRTLELGLSKSLMKRFSKVIALTKFLAEDFAPGKPYLVVEGIIDLKDSVNPADRRDKGDKNQLTIVYTGGVSKKYGVDNIVNAIILLKDENVVLDVFGSGEYVDELRNLCKIHPNIRYHGFVSNQLALKAQQTADFLINARNPVEEFVKYSFPSKNLEYMLSGTPLITTLLPGMPHEYSEFVIGLNNNSPEDICEMLNYITGLSFSERRKIGLRAYNFATTRNFKEQGERILDFIDF